MNIHERDMIEFALKWAPYGGGDEHILPTFGVLPPEFYRRVLTILTYKHPNGVDVTTCSFLREFCASKIPAPAWAPVGGQ